DRLGIKPLYYAELSQGVVFASELTPITSSGLGDFQPDPLAVRDLMLYQFIVSPRSFYSDIKRLQPGHALMFRKGHVQAHRYWQLDARTHPTISHRATALAEFQAHFDHAVRSHLISDAPLGAFLSGGIDSSYLVARVQKQIEVPMDTFTARFVTKDARYDEADWARVVAKELGTNHHEVVIEESELMSAVPEVIARMDEPLADPALVPTYLLSKFARERVKVVLTGEGADEIFAGYPRYLKQRLRARFLGEPKRYRPTFVF